MGLFTRKPAKRTTPRTAYCSFCRKSHTEVGPLVEGPNDVYICHKCMLACQAIFEKEAQRREAEPPPAGE